MCHILRQSLRAGCSLLEGKGSTHWDHSHLSSIHTHAPYNRFTALWILSGTTQVSRYQKKHSPIHTHRGHQSSLSAFSIYYDTWHPPYSIHVLYSLFPQSLSKFSLVYLLAWYPPIHTPYISSPNHYLLFATHAHTIATCFAVVWAKKNSHILYWQIDVLLDFTKTCLANANIG